MFPLFLGVLSLETMPLRDLHVQDAQFLTALFLNLELQWGSLVQFNYPETFLGRKTACLALCLPPPSKNNNRTKKFTHLEEGH